MTVLEEGGFLEVEFRASRWDALKLVKELTMRDLREHGLTVDARTVDRVLVSLAGNGLIREDRLAPGMTVERWYEQARAQRRQANAASAQRMW